MEEGRPNPANKYSAEGTAAHEIAALCLRDPAVEPHDFVGQTREADGFKIFWTEELADLLSVYVNYVRDISLGKELLIEVRLDLSEVTGIEGQFGTADAVIFDAEHRCAWVIDLKFGKRHVEVVGNRQARIYGLGALPLAEMLGIEVDAVMTVIVQPKNDYIGEDPVPLADMATFKAEVQTAVAKAEECIILPKAELLKRLTPSEKACEWCLANRECPAYDAFVSEQVTDDFETLSDPNLMSAAYAENELPLKIDPTVLGHQFALLPMIEHWCKAKRAETERRVFAGEEIIGPDMKVMKIVEGKKGRRGWENEEMAEGLLVGSVGDKAYKPREIITAPAADKLLNKKATKNLWTDVFVPLIKQAPGKPSVVLGSDPRPVYSGVAADSEFEDLEASPE